MRKEITLGSMKQEYTKGGQVNAHLMGKRRAERAGVVPVLLEQQLAEKSIDDILVVTFQRKL
jgi:hypothetical protein